MIDEPNLVAWGKFLGATTDEDLKKLAMEHPVLDQAKDALERLSADPEARARAEQRETALLMHELGLAQALRQGRKEGKAEGRAEARAELLQQLLTLKFGALPPAHALHLKGATETQLTGWAERLLSAESLEGVFGD